MKTFFTRIDNTEQYNRTENKIIWEDDREKKWETLYNNLRKNDNAVFLGKNVIYIGIINKINNLKSIEVKDVDSFQFKNDNFLRINSVFPEYISRCKATFPPFILEKVLDIDQIKSDIQNQKLIDFYIFKSQKDFTERTINLKDNDRVLLLDEKGKINDISIYNQNVLKKADFNNNLNSFGKTLNELLKVTTEYKGEEVNSNNVNRIKKIKEQLKKQKYFKFDSFSAYHDTLYNKRIYGDRKIDVTNANFQSFQMQNSIDPLNQILYGPPGTGKTYHTINKAIEICNPSFNLEQDRKVVKAEFDRLVKAEQIVFTTFHQSMSYEDFIEGIKPLKPEEGDEFVKYDVIEGVFKKLCVKAKENNSTQLHDNFDEAWEKLIEFVRSNIANNQLVKIGSWEYGLSSKDSLKYSSLNSPSQYSFTITKQNVYDAYQNRQARPSGAFQKDMVEIVDYMKKEMGLNEYDENQSKVSVPSLNYVLIIDEINRGNVSQIFGELITLIEESKRLGNDEALEVTLPYSKETFGVPPNLYIIGTMNTADRSVEALDTALRRRFSFKEMMPDENVILDKNFTDYDRAAIMRKINQRVEVLLDRNYTLGHSYFIKEDFKNSFENEIIPLLQEYFYNDYGKIGLVLGKGFVREKAITTKDVNTIFADFDTKNEVDIIKSYELIPFAEDVFDFDTAIQTLLA